MSIYDYLLVDETERTHMVFLFPNGFGASVIKTESNSNKMSLILIQESNEEDYVIIGDDHIRGLDNEDLWTALNDIANGNIENYYF